MRASARLGFARAVAIGLVVACSSAPPPITSPTSSPSDTDTPAAPTVTVTATATAGPQRGFGTENGMVVFDGWPGDARRRAAQKLPAGFVDEILAAGLTQPVAVRELPDGSFLVAEQRGVVRHVSPGAPATEVLDLRAEVLNYMLLGMLGLAVDPEFPAEPYIYLSYTRDAPLGADAPTYGGAGDVDACPDRNSCPASARVVRFRLEGDPPRAVGPAEVLLDDWCITTANHTIGALMFGSDGSLYAGGGDGADGEQLDYGQRPTPPNGCGDPPTAAGVAPDASTSEGGSLRSQDVGIGNDPVTLSGAIVRVDRTTGDGLPDNPLAASPDANARRIIAHGLRNPFRFTFRPGTDELWIGDVGFVRWEEVNVAPDATPERPYNFGWPCFEGPTRNVVWDAVGNAACEDLYADAQGVDFPHFAFGRDRLVDEPCPAGSAALSALAFYDGAAFPDAYRDALFLADHAQACLWVMPAGADGLPDPARIRAFATGVRIPDLIVGSDGALYYVSAVAGQLHRISWRG